MENMEFPLAIQLALVDDLVGSTDWTGAKLHLFNNDITPSEDTVLADLTAAIYSGYAPIVVVWSTAFFDANGVPVSSGGETLFAQSGATGDLVYGAYVTNAAGSKLLASARLDDAPFSFTVDGDTLPLTVKVGNNLGTIAAAIVP